MSEHEIIDFIHRAFAPYFLLKENETELVSRLNAYAERRVAEAVARWGWTTTTCPDGQVGCYLPPGHTHHVSGPHTDRTPEAP